MARLKSVNELIDQLEPTVRKAFEQAVDSIRNDIRFADLERAIAASDVAQAMAVIGLNESYFGPLEEALRAAHIQAATETYDGVKQIGSRRGVRVSGKFNTRNLRAEQLVRRYSSDRVVEITQATVQALRESLDLSMRAGTSPRTVALDLVGRIGPSGKRVGGIVGLDSQKAEWVRSMRDDLLELHPNYFKRKLRNRSFDPVVRRAMASGRPLPRSVISLATEAYSNRLLRLRGEAIARTELLTSLHAAQQEGLNQLVDIGQVPRSAIKETWDSSADKFTRPDHRAAHKQPKENGVFLVGGYAMAHPGDSSRGAPAKQTIQCRCTVRVDINFMQGLRASLTPEELAMVRAAF